jgi:protoporphyrinogen/coproporphyrinogen III oxidase
MTPEPGQRHVVVIGGGISGLVAARTLAHSSTARTPEAREIDTAVTILESGPKFGGKLQTSSFAGVGLDTGPDAFLARLPQARQLCEALGVETIAPSRSTAWIWSRDALRRFPDKTVLGVPSSIRSLTSAGVLPAQAIARAAMDYMLPDRVGRPNEDQSIGNLIRARFGEEVADRLVDPLIGGIYGSNIDELSLEAAAPQIAELAAMGPSLLKSARTHVNRRSTEDRNAPVFRTPTHGMASLVSALLADLRHHGVKMQPSTYVEKLVRTQDGRWEVVTAEGRTHIADAVVLATPTFATARIVEDEHPELAANLRDISYSSVGIIRLAYRSAAVKRSLDGTGFVTPRVDGHLITACSWASSKWAHLARPGQVVLRASVGRMGDDRFMEMSDHELIDKVHSELTAAMVITERPLMADVTRWEHSFPQYSVKHNTKVLQIERNVSQMENIAICGAAYHGLGIPACIKTATEAVEALLTRMANAYALSE